MSKSQNITSEQLTKQYLNGNLHNGDEYYIKDKDGEISTIYLYNGPTFWRSFKVEKLKILAPVPSYEELEQLKNWARFTDDYHELREKLEIAEYENAQLKEQINKCCLDAINRGTANAVKAVKEFGMPERIKELVEQNAQLKELLKECRDEVNPYIEVIGGKKTFKNLIDKIDEVLNA